MTMTPGQQLFLVFAFVLFILGAWSRWWGPERQYYPAFISAGLAFCVAAVLFSRYL